ncbi:lipase family protein [Nocardia vinacea]|uniref:Lipase family protein n=1 Tax=Nocardia vinacea TaxID=96468 RepID=A0ABZ1YMY1_9NOCA|nr:lipase family protein [Nocardia vinacea]
MRFLVLIVGTICALAGSPTVHAKPATSELAPTQQDSFYQAPASLSAFTPGAIVAARPVELAIPDLPADTRAWQISFRSNDSHDQPILGVTTLLVPTTPWPGPDPRPAVSVQFAEDAVSEQCAPSRTMQSGSGIGLQANETSVPVALLRRGWAVAVPDHEGPRSAFSAGHSGGHIVLDGIRAARQFEPGDLTAATPWGLTGYSGGAAISGWAAQLQSSYAPELPIVGAALGGIPSDLLLLSRFNGEGAASPLVIATLAGIDAEYPEVGIASLLNPQGTQVFSRIRQMCTEQSLTSLAFTSLRSLSAAPDLLGDPRVADVLARNTLGRFVPRVPIYSFHGVLDEIVPVSQADDMTRQWCAGGANVQIVRDGWLDHVLEGLVRQQDAAEYLADRFAGLPAPNGC